MSEDHSSDSNNDGIVQNSKKALEKAFGEIGKSSATKQLVVGTLSGWVTGYMGMKLGKVAAVGLGSGVILLHLATQAGYIRIDWDKIHKNVDTIGEKMTREADRKSAVWLDKMITFMRANSYYSAGFTGGVLFGIASS